MCCHSIKVALVGRVRDRSGYERRLEGLELRIWKLEFEFMEMLK